MLDQHWEPGKDISRGRTDCESLKVKLLFNSYVDQLQLTYQSLVYVFGKHLP